MALPEPRRRWHAAARALGASLVVAAASLLAGAAQAQTAVAPSAANPVQQALDDTRQALARQEALAGTDDVSLLPLLDRLGRVHAASGRLDLALPVLERALSIRERKLGPDHPEWPQGLNNLAELLRQMGQLPRALALQQRAVASFERRPGSDPVGLAVSLNNLALVLQALGRFDEALTQLRASLALREAALGPDHLDVANSLNNLGEYYRAVGPPEQALPYYERSLVIVERVLGPDHPVTATLLANQAGLDVMLARYDRALPRAERSLAIRERRFGPLHPEVGTSLNILAEVHRALGQFDRALPLLQRSLAVYETTLGPTHPDVAMALSNLGAFYAESNRRSEALPLYERSLSIVEQRLGATHPHVASALNNLGTHYQETGQWPRALEAHRRGLAIREAALGPTHPEIAVSLHNLAKVQLESNAADDAMALLQRALNISHASPAGSRVLWKSQQLIGQVYAERGQTDLAIVWGKEAVNTLQSVRSGLITLDRGVQAGYLQANRSAYDRLADLLIAQGRLAEAQDLLQMLKEDELHEGLQRAERADPRTTRMELTGLERARFARYYTLRDQQAELGAERRELEAKARIGPLSPVDAARLREIVERLMPVAARAMQVFLAQLEQDMAGSGAAGAGTQVQASRLRVAVDALADSEPRAAAAGVQYLVTPERLSIVLSLPGTPPIAYQQAIGRDALYRHLQRVQLALGNPSAEPAFYVDSLKALYGLLIEPIEADLQRYGVRTLMLSLDDQLRLIPFAALMNPRGRYLVQDYALALYNEAARQALTKGPSRNWRVAAMGLSESVDDLPALASVPEEIAGIVRARGVDGQAYLNQNFDRARLLGSLEASQPFNVLHVASHFVLQPGVPAQSRLYLGDKSRLSLADIAREDLRFGNFDLVTFSACETARGGGRQANGQEMESLGAKTQSQGAQAVMATLWKVADRSTGSFMQHFYAAHAQPGMNKAQALREAQLAMIDGRLRPPTGNAWTAPYHWAPFVLMGNWR